MREGKQRTTLCVTVNTLSPTDNNIQCAADRDT